VRAWFLICHAHYNGSKYHKETWDNYVNDWWPKVSPSQRLPCLRLSQARDRSSATRANPNCQWQRCQGPSVCGCACQAFGAATVLHEPPLFSGRPDDSLQTAPFTDVQVTCGNFENMKRILYHNRWITWILNAHTMD
jgi:hypothetical protein